MTTINTHVEADRDLLQAYASRRDADAFAQLVRRYAGLVFATARRVTGNTSDAEDVSQTCFMELARQAGRVTGSVPGWLHRTASHRAASLIRDSAARRRREQIRQQASMAAGTDQPEWDLIEPIVDQVIAELPEELGDPLVRHYLRGVSQSDLAAEAGVSQPTISRRIDHAIDVLRGRLAEAGVSAPVLAVTAGLTREASVTAPADLTASLVKLGLAGVGAGPAAAVAGGAIKLAIAAVGAVLLISAAVALYQIPTSSTPQTPQQVNAMGTTQASTSPNPRTIRLSGHGQREDSVSLALAAVANALGTQADHGRLYALSANAFAPAINAGETCCSWWHNQARMGTQNLPAMAAALGLKATRLDVPEPPAGSSDDQAIQAAAQAVLKAMQDGAIVITEGGWDEVGAWNWSGVVTDVSPDGVIRGSSLSANTTEGKVDVPWKYPGKLWAITKGDRAAPAKDADIALLRQAVSRIRGTGVYRSSGGDLYGLEAMDKWIAQMRDVRGFCVECFARTPVVGVQDAPDNDARMYEAALVAADQLRNGMDGLPGECRPYLDSAADHYDRVAALLAPAASGQGGFSYDTLNSLAAQGQYAADVLEPVRTEIASAADDMQSALNMGNVVRDGRQVYIPGAEDAVWGNETDQQDSIIAATTVAMNVMGEDVSFMQMMGWGGSAFRVQMHRGTFSPASPFALIGRDNLTLALTALGYGVEWIHTANHDGTPIQAGIDKAAPLIRESIDVGVPALATSEESGLLVGYLTAGGLIMRAYSPNGPGYTERTDWPWSIGILRRTGARPSPRERTISALREAVVMANTAAYADGKEFAGDAQPDHVYDSGFAAYAAWAKRLRTDATPNDLFGNGYTYGCLWSARQNAGPFLRQAAADLPADAAAHAVAAADLYDRIVKVSAEPRPNLRHPWMYMPWDLKGVWTPEMRAAQADMLDEIAKLEKEAIAEIEQALILAGAPPATQPAPAEPQAQLQRRILSVFHEVAHSRGDMNPVRTNLLMRLVCLRAAGAQDVDYETLVMLSGNGTSFAYDRDNYGVMYQPPDDPATTEQRLVDGTGCGFEWLPRVRSAQEAWPIIVQTLDGGRPLQAQWLDDFVIAAYRDDADPMKRGVYALGKWGPPRWMGWAELDEWARDFGRFGRATGQAVTRKDLSRLVLERAVQWSRGDGRADVEWMKGAAFGLGGMEAYANDLADVTLGPDAFQAAWLACHAANRQSSGRQCASIWLARLATASGEPMATHLRQASELYRQAYESWTQFRRILGTLPGEPQAIALDARWRDPDARARAAALIQQAANLERQAVAEIAQSLTAN
jgi:RNA polymerase sigma-70 factor (ECF subfamily)